MTISLKHRFVSAVPDDGDTSRVRPSNWNDEHNIHMASGFMLGRLTSGTGDVEEISAAALLTWSGAVVGPASATNNAIPRFDGTTGKLIQNSLVTIDDAGAMTINTSGVALQAPMSGVGLHVSNGDASNPRILTDAYGQAIVPQFIGRKARGTPTAPSAVQNLDVLINVQAWGYGATGYSVSGRGNLQFLAAENWTDAAQGTRFRLQTTPNGTVVPADHLFVEANGDVTPGANGAQKLGTSALKWSEINAVAGVFTGNVGAATATLSGSVNIGTGTADNPFVVEFSQNSALWARFRNPNVGASATVGLLFGGDGSAAQASIFVNSNAKTDFGGFGSINIGNYGAAGVGFFTNNVYRGGWDSSGRLIIGPTASVPIGSTNAASPQVQMHGTDGHNVMSLYRWSADANAAVFDFFKSRGASIGTRGIVQSGDVLGTITWRGDDGTNSPTAAHIRAVVDGTPGAGDMPTRLEWATTPDGSSSPVLRGSVNSAGRWLLSGDLTIGFASLSPYAPKVHFGGVTAAATPTLGAVTGITAMFSNTDSAYGLAVGSTGGGATWMQVQRIDGTATAYNLRLQPSGGFVGVGPISPGYMLDVRDTADNVMRLSGGGANSMAWLLRADNGGTTQEYQFGVTKTTHPWGKGFYIYSNTDARLDFFINASGHLAVGGTSANLAGVAKTITLQDATPGNTVAYELATNGSLHAYLAASNATARLMTNGALPLLFGINNTERMRIAASGDVGITNKLAVGSVAGTVPTATLDINGDVVFRHGSLTLVNGTNNNVAKPAFTAARITGPTAAFTITGITGGVDGVQIELINTTSFNLTLNNEDAASTAGNRISTDTAGNITCKHATLRYDGTSARWRVISFRT